MQRILNVMNELTKKWSDFKQSRFVRNLNRVLLCKYFPFLSTVISLICYYTGFDILGFYNLAITTVLICLFADDLTPALTPILFLTVLPSKKSTSISEYLGQTHILAQLIVLAVIVVLAIIFRFSSIVVRKKFKPTPVFYGLCFLSLAFILNGIFSENAQFKNFLYGLAMAFFFLGIFTFLKDDIDVSKEGIERIAFTFFAFSFVPIIELLVAYITTEGLISDGGINRGLLAFGWGTYNSVGLLTNISIPFVIYLAGKKKLGFIFTAYSVLMLAVVALSCSRQAMISAAVVYPASIIALFIKGKNKIMNAITVVSAFLVCLTILLIFHDKLFDYFIKLFKSIKVNGEWNGNGRTALWEAALENFKKAPIFGFGFYVDLLYILQYSGGVWPMMYHNTFMELLGACGIVGLIAYLFHRVQTVQSFFRNATYERFVVSLVILVLLITNIFDNPIFKIMPTMVYSFMLAVLVKSEKTE